MLQKNRVLASFLAVSVGLLLPVQALAEPVKLEEGSPIRLKLLDTISSGTNHEGDSVGFQVIDDVLAADGTTVLIKAGAPAWGNVTNVEERGRMGEKGEISLSVSGTKSIDGKKVPLRATVNRDGKAKVGSVIALSLIVTPLFLFMRGKDAKVPAGSQVNAYIDRDVMVETQTAAKAPNAEATVSASVAGSSQPVTADTAKESLKSLEQLYHQGILDQKEYEAKKKALTSY